ncbi:MAG: hypothetical protein ACR2L3_00390 [Actinomycetota bacterium]
MASLEFGKNRKTYEEAFTSFRDEVLDVLDMKRTDEKFKRELLGKVVLWHPTGFFPVRHRSRGAALRRPGGKLDRDHVFDRRYLVAQVLGGRDLREIFEMAGTLCYVTPKEHVQLGLQKDKVGWDRYTATGIRVYGMDEDPE